MKMKRFIILTVATLAALVLYSAEARAQHVVAVTTGYGMATSRLYPAQETKPIWGTWSAGVSWRYYSLPRFVGGFGIDLEWIERGFSYAPYASIYEDKKEYKYYTRRINTLMMPIVWQPHAYLFKNHLRVYLEAALTLSYNFSSSFENREPYTFGANPENKTVISGKYDMRSERDNSFGYGLAAGGGIDILIKQVEIGFRVRYDIGYSDILRNRNKYYDNELDNVNKPGENPFWRTPLRSPLDNLTIGVRVGWRFNKEGFEAWKVKRKKRQKEVIKFGL